jgi:hypothetical protein
MSDYSSFLIGAGVALLVVVSCMFGVYELEAASRVVAAADAGQAPIVKATFAEASLDPVITDLKPGELRFKDEHGAVRVRSGLTNAWPVVIDVFVPGDIEKYWRVSIEADGSMQTEQRRYQP